MEFRDTDQTDSDESDEDLESELYSVLHYNILSGEIPSEILNKYDIKRSENEFLISFKNNEKRHDDISQEEELSEKSCSRNENIESYLEVVTISDDESDSVIIVNNPGTKTTDTCNPSVIEINDSSSSDEMEDIIINVDDPSSISCSSPVEHLKKSVTVKWKEVVSPSNWTTKMKKYYNDPCKNLLNFNYEKISNELKAKGDKWDIIPADRFPSKKNSKRCSVCRQTDHLRKNCPRRFLNCHMCGKSGHGEFNCPYKKCLNCGQRSKIFVDMCQKCEEKRFQTCSECKQTGHSSNLCPDTWRRFNVTTKGDLVVKQKNMNDNILCCNCAQRGHHYENCPKIYWSIYPPTSFLVINKQEINPKVSKGKRSRSFDASSYDFDRTPKIPRGESTLFHRKYNQFNQTYPRFNQPYIQFNQPHSPFNHPNTSFKLSPAGTPKRNKKRYFQNTLIDNKGNITNHAKNSRGSPRQRKVKKRKKKASPNNTV